MERHPIRVKPDRSKGDLFADARCAWRMGPLPATESQDFPLRENGPVRIERLGLPELGDSLAQEGDGFAAVLKPDAFLSLDIRQATALRPSGDALTLYVRARFEPDAAGTLFFSDFLTLGVHPSGLAIALLGVKTSTGKVYRELPLAMVDRGEWMDFVLRVRAGRAQLFCDASLMATEIGRAHV